MASHVDELVTLLTMEGDGVFAAKMRGLGGFVQQFGDKNRAMLDRVAFMGPYFSAAAQKLQELSMASVEAFNEGEYVDNQLKSMFDVKGYSPESLTSMRELASQMQDMGGINDETTKRTAAMMASFDLKPGEITRLLPYIAMQADLMRAPMEGVGAAIGKAFSSGNYGILKRYGITLDYAAMAELKQAQAMAKTGDAAQIAAGKAKAMDIITKALADNTPRLEDRLNTARGRADRFAATMDDVKEQMGAGIMAMTQYGRGLMMNLVAPLSSGHEGMLKVAGGGAYVGGALLKGFGAIGNMSRDIVAFNAALSLARGGQVAADAANAAGIPARMAGAAATNANTAATMGAARANFSLAASLYAALLPAAILTSAIAALVLWYRDLKVLQETTRERKYSKDTDEYTQQMLKSRGLKREKGGGVVRDEKATEESKREATEWLAKNRGKETDVSWRTTGSGKWADGEQPRPKPGIGRGATPASAPVIQRQPAAPTMDSLGDTGEDMEGFDMEGGYEEASAGMGVGNVFGSHATNAGRGLTSGRPPANRYNTANAIREPAGDIVVRIKGGQGISENDLRDFNLVAQ